VEDEKLVFTPEELGVNMAQSEFRDWPARLKLFREQLNIEKDTRSHERAFEIEAAIYISHEGVFSLRANRKFGFGETELQQFVQGFYGAMAELLAGHGWKVEDLGSWEQIRDERFREYLDLTADLTAGGDKSAPGVKLGRAFITHALPTLKPSDAEMLILGDAINFHAAYHIAEFTKEMQEIMAAGKKLLWQNNETPDGPVTAGFNERFLAYVIDALPFVAVCYASFSLLLKKGLLSYSVPLESKWKFLWILAYLVYETVLSSGGRATLGKFIMGIRVKAAGRAGSGLEDLGFFKALLRSLAYFLSAFTLNLGFLLALFTRNKRALHDYIAGSRVVSLRERGDAANGLIMGLSWALMAVFCWSWINQYVLKMTPFEKRQVITAYTTISKLGVLEKIYLKENGYYTNDLKRLAAITGNVKAVRAELLKNLADNSLSIASDGRGYIITAKARNWRKTEVQVTSPPPPSAP